MPNTVHGSDNRLFRRRGLFALLGAGLFGGICALSFAPSALKNYLETYGSRINLAQVEIRNLSIDWLRARITIDDIQVAHHTQPMRNLVGIDQITIDIAPAAILKRKLIVTNLKVTGIHLFSARETSGLIDLSRDNVGPGLLDRASGVYAELRRDVERNPLRRLAQLSTGLGLDLTVDSHRNKLTVLRALQTAQKQLDATTRSWEQTSATVPTDEWLAERRAKVIASLAPRAVASEREYAREIAKELKQSHEALTRARDTIRSDAATLGKSLVDLDRFADRDIETLRQSLDLPQFDSGDLTVALFGPRALNFLERLAYWIDLSRRRMPVGARHGQIGVVQRHSGPGTSYHFGKASALPTFLIEKAEIVSTSSPSDASLGEVRGTIEDLTTDPPIWRKPTRFAIVAEFPGRKIYGVRAEGTLDHTGDEPFEQMSLRIASAPVTGLSLYDGTDLTLALSRATTVLKFESVFKGTSVDAKWKAAAIDIDFGVRSTYPQVEDFVRDSLRGPNALELAGHASGQLDKLSLQLTSDIGRQLGAALKGRFRHALGAIDDALRNDLLDEYDPARQALMGRLRDAQYRYLSPIEAKTIELQSLIELAEKTSGRTSRRASRR